MADRVEVRPSTDYPCARMDCGNRSVVVEHVYFTRNGGSKGVAFYGRCAEHVEVAR